jgi:DNA replication protein DnaC
LKTTWLGGEYKLRLLNDREYSEAERLARLSGVALDICPTCGGREEEIPGSGGVRAFASRAYKFRGEEHECNCQVQMALRARYLLANIGDQYMRLDWADFDGSQEAQKWVPYYIGHWKSFKQNGMGMEFGGESLGVGKTFAATTIGKGLIREGQRVFFIPFIEMVSSFESDDATELDRKMRETTFLILDEILPAKSERQRDFFADKFEALIRFRTNFNLPTIITTNLGEEQIAEDYPRTYSLLQAKQIRVDMSGSDKRMGQIRQENMDLVLNDEVRPIT